jgi:hypothetical protein
MGTFFQNMFGAPANCFGQAHINAILETYANMQRELFGSHNGSVTAYLREQIRNRFGVEDIPDSFLFLPEEFGGLGLHNPYVPYLMLKNQIMEDPLRCIEGFQQKNLESYKAASRAFAARRLSDKKGLFKLAAGASTEYDEALLNAPFFSYEEYATYPEIYSSSLRGTYEELMAKPSAQTAMLTHESEPWFEELKHSHGKGWYDLSNEHKWIMDLYAAELVTKFGALSIVDTNLLPGGIVKMMKRKKVTWQLIIWD